MSAIGSRRRPSDQFGHVARAAFHHGVEHRRLHAEQYRRDLRGRRGRLVLGDGVSGQRAGLPAVAAGTVASDSTCWALTPPGDFSAGLLTFTAPANTVLAKDTTYTAVFVPTSSTVHFRGTTSDAEDGVPRAGASTTIRLLQHQRRDVQNGLTAAPRSASPCAGEMGRPPPPPARRRTLWRRRATAEVTLSWAAPASDGGGAITEYEYRYSTGSTVLPSATWTDVADGSDAGRQHRRRDRRHHIEPDQRHGVRIRGARGEQRGRRDRGRSGHRDAGGGVLRRAEFRDPARASGRVP